ncbi:HlyD family type I secretion periplasmic adaptor subunit [Undibacterium sp. CY18W]|uniref:Membrane fusion protein (MFP) family protein n=1 Tax=Undibacterium hunanense TaxID=2762292 RepID=A0ABR6ZVK0_9BURK|nr:HlyD family type I secretion periplasmic adaptor subunit [Undibacterium hunanense]MBC3919664.1 HlyD family type I secretion periplasmic adaptor subunit [Undibacterium hunanense]
MSKESGRQENVLSPDALDFAPGLLAIQDSPPARLPRVTLYMVATLFLVLIVWAVFGRLDIVASAEGRLVPQSYVKIVQPADAGIVQEILIQDGQHVVAGQVLMRMDTKDATADGSTLQTQLALRSLQLRRIDAELNNKPMLKMAGDPDDLLSRILSQYTDHRRVYTDAMEQIRQTNERATHDASSGREVLGKLREVVPLLKQQAESYAEMGKDGYVAQLQVQEKQREYIEKSRDLKAQESTLASLESAVIGTVKQMAELTSKYRSELQNERIDAEGQYRKLQQDMVKHEHKTSLLELKAPQAGIVKDLATHTAGTVVSPGTVLLSLVPDNEALVAEIMVKNDDVGFVYPHQNVKVKLAAYPFQQYGMLDGEVLTIGADASDMQQASQGSSAKEREKSGSATIYKALISLKSQQLDIDNKQYKLLPGMQVIAEINQGKRTVLEYILSPLQKTVKESGRER